MQPRVRSREARPATGRERLAGAALLGLALLLWWWLRSAGAV
ncbi:MAG TPA: hypothetical protein VJV23_15570 [Candidatus Polarisedimenticolia bacterium]|nr:hypothetical protein [Candidatus Polarisedimenticolia bacterium]